MKKLIAHMTVQLDEEEFSVFRFIGKQGRVEIWKDLQGLFPEGKLRAEIYSVLLDLEVKQLIRFRVEPSTSYLDLHGDYRDIVLTKLGEGFYNPIK